MTLLRHLHPIFLLLLAFLAVGSFSACSTPGADAPIVGTWDKQIPGSFADNPTLATLAGQTGERTITFNEDFTFKFKSGNSGRWVAGNDGFYKARDTGGRDLIFYQAKHSPLLYCLGEPTVAQPLIDKISQGYSLAVLNAKNEIAFLIEYQRATIDSSKLTF